VRPGSTLTSARLPVAGYDRGQLAERSANHRLRCTIAGMRWRRRLLVAAEVALVVVALGALGLWCSVPNTERLADENPTSTAFIDLRREQNPKLKVQWQWVRLGRISRYLRAAVVY